ncbi:hypothetical protein [Corallococcus sp. Z5C101001]|uniref:hypothetical protein n=1 Tax=Corallococcus sp. Z5C101001 TaxID=2596829 RepID=UPI0021051A01|nr:hypothetical protein [Corallococcus sp. Z5C101001]
MRTLKQWACVAGALSVLAVGCGPEDSPWNDPTSGLQELDSCKGDNKLADGGKYFVNNNWGDMGVQDQGGYTGIDNSNPNDKGVIDAEKKAAAALDGGGCIYGAHGGNPATCGGQTSVQGLPNDTSQSIFHNEYHPECGGKPLILSVCYSGAKGTNGYQPIAAVVSGNYNVPPEKIMACTGTVAPGVPMRCFGTIVDGNGKAIGDQKVGGVDFVQVRGEPGPNDVVRCKPNDTCPTCTPDAGVDAGTDGGVRPDAGVDAGTVDAGTDGGVRPDAGVDAGTVDAGTVDAGTDGGVRPDAGVDAGTVDAGPPPFDAGVIIRDAGVIVLNAHAAR